MADSVPDEVQVVNTHTNAILAAIAGVDDVMAMNALISAFANRAYKSGKRLGASVVLQKLGRRMQACGTPAEFVHAPLQERPSVPLPALPSQIPEGYSPEDIDAMQELCRDLSLALDGYANHVAMSGLLSMYVAVAEATGDLLGAAQHLVRTGTGLLEEQARLGGGIPTPDSSTKH